jgi:hypothetical protein
VSDRQSAAAAPFGTRGVALRETRSGAGAENVRKYAGNCARSPGERLANLATLVFDTLYDSL